MDIIFTHLDSTILSYINKDLILEWTTSLDFICEGGCPRFVRDVHVTSNVELRNNVRLLLNVELRNYVISRQIVERRVT